VTKAPTRTPSPSLKRGPRRDAFAYLAAAIRAAWGVIHVAPTRQVVTSMEPSTNDSRLVITQEWIVEALAMWGSPRS
jgi:hypothetical protein